MLQRVANCKSSITDQSGFSDKSSPVQPLSSPFFASGPSGPLLRLNHDMMRIPRPVQRVQLGESKLWRVTVGSATNAGIRRAAFQVLIEQEACWNIVLDHISYTLSLGVIDVAVLFAIFGVSRLVKLCQSIEFLLPFHGSAFLSWLCFMLRGDNPPLVTHKSSPW